MGEGNKQWMGKRPDIREQKAISTSRAEGPGEGEFAPRAIEDMSPGGSDLRGAACWRGGEEPGQSREETPKQAVSPPTLWPQPTRSHLSRSLESLALR